MNGKKMTEIVSTDDPEANAEIAMNGESLPNEASSVSLVRPTEPVEVVGEDGSLNEISWNWIAEAEANNKATLNVLERSTRSPQLTKLSESERLKRIAESSRALRASKAQKKVDALRARQSDPAIFIESFADRMTKYKSEVNSCVEKTGLLLSILDNPKYSAKEREQLILKHFTSPSGYEESLDAFSVGSPSLSYLSSTASSNASTSSTSSDGSYSRPGSRASTSSSTPSTSSRKFSPYTNKRLPSKTVNAFTSTSKIIEAKMELKNSGLNLGPSVLTGVSISVKSKKPVAQPAQNDVMDTMAFLNDLEALNSNFSPTAEQNALVNEVLNDVIKDSVVGTT